MTSRLRHLVPMLILPICGLGLGGCSCHSLRHRCLGAPSPAQTASLNATSIRRRLMLLAHMVGPRVGGVLIDSHGEVWVSTALNVEVGVAADGSRLHYSPGHGDGPTEGDADFDPTRGRDIPLRAIQPEAFVRVLRRVRFLRPNGEDWEDAKLVRVSDGTLVWSFEFVIAEFRARVNGSGFCRESPHDDCRGSLDDFI